MSYPNLELHSAAASGNVGLVHYALTHGQPVNAVLHGVLPLHAACSGGSEPVVRMLIDRGADVNAPRLPRRYSENGKSTPSVGHSGSTPLHFAAANGHVRIVRILLSSGATYDKQDKHGATPLALAEANGHEEVVETLLTWTALLEEEKLKIRQEMQEQREAEEDGGDDVFEEEDASPVLEKKGRWNARASSAPQRVGEEKQEKAMLRKSIENIFHGRRSNAPTPSILDGKGSPSGRGSVDGRSAPGSAVPQRVQDMELAGRRPSLPSIFERASHPGHSLRAALRRGSFASQIAPSDATSFKRRSTQTDVDETGSSIDSSSIRYLSRQSLLNLFRRGTGHGASPPSRSPSPPTPAQLPLSSADLDDSVEKLRRASMEGSRPGTSYGRPRSTSQVTFQDSVIGRSSTPSAGSSGGSGNNRVRALVEGVQQAGEENGFNKAGGNEEAPGESIAGPGPSTLATLMDHAGSQSPVSDSTIEPIRRLPRQRSRLSSEVVTPSPLGLDLDPGGGPRSILRHRTEGSPLSPLSDLYPTSTSPVPTKRRAATLPSSYLPRERKSANGDGGVGKNGQGDMPLDGDVPAEDGPRAPSWYGRHRGTSNGSVRSSAASSIRESPSRTPPVVEESFDSVSEAAGQIMTSEEGPSQRSASNSHGRFRNKSISSISSFTSINGHASSTQATSYTHSFLSSNLHGQAPPHTPVLEEPRDLAPSKRQYLGRRSSQRATQPGTLLYDVPVHSSDCLPGSNPPRMISTREEADDFLRQTERGILEAISIASIAESPDFSLAAQLAAYGDTHAFAEQLGSPEAESFKEVDSLRLPDGQVSRSYIQRPPSIRQESGESIDTIVESMSRRTSKSWSASDSGNALPGGAAGFANRRLGSDVSGKARSQPPPPIFVPEAPDSSLPSISRIYESRAAAYRNQSKALAQTAPIFTSSNRTRSSSRPIAIQDHWAIAGVKQQSHSSAANAESLSEASLFAISSPLPQLAEPPTSDSGKRKKLRSPGSLTSDWSGRPTMNASSAARIGVLASVKSPVLFPGAPKTTETLMPPPAGRSSRGSVSPAHSAKSSPPPPKKTHENGAAAEGIRHAPRSIFSESGDGTRRVSIDMVSSRLGKMSTGATSRKFSGSSVDDQSRRSSEGRNATPPPSSAKPKWGESLKSAMGALGRHK